MRVIRVDAAVILLSLLCVGPAVRGEKPRSSTVGMRVGTRAVISGVDFACGAWAEVSRGTCPAAARGREPKIAVYTRDLNADVLRLAAAVDAAIVKDPTLRWSFVEVIDKKGGRKRARAERQARLEEMRTLAKKAQLKKLTIGLARNPWNREAERLDMEQHDVLLVFLDRAGTRSRMVKYAKRLHFADLKQAKIAGLLDEVRAVRTR